MDHCKLRLQAQRSMMKKQSNTNVKRKPMKIVYIGNPMMFKANNHLEFRKIVQELTGQDSQTEKSTRSSPASSTDTANLEVVMNMKVPTTYASPKTTKIFNERDDSVDGESSVSGTSSTGFIDDFFSVEMLESFGGLQYPFLDL